MHYLDVHTHSREVAADTIRWTNFMPNREEPPQQQPFTVGYHPYYLYATDFTLLEKHLRDPNCKALGECGLDKRCATDWNLQLQILNVQLELAVQCQKPLLFHCVGAFGEIQQICKQQLKKGYPKIIHGFSKKKELARELLNNGFTLSIGHRVLQSVTLQEAVAEIPLENLLIETDGHPVEIRQLYEKVAQIKGIDPDYLTQQLHENSIRLTHQL